MTLPRALLAGSAAGAAGATALNAATYLDMVARGRPTSSTPEDTVKKMVGKTGVTIPGDSDTRPNRISGLGALNGIAVGVGVGAALGVARFAGWRPRLLPVAAVAAAVAMAITDGTMAALGVTDLRNWAAADWLSDALPHLAYGLVTASVLLASGPGDAR